MLFSEEDSIYSLKWMAHCDWSLKGVSIQGLCGSWPAPERWSSWNRLWLRSPLSTDYSSSAVFCTEHCWRHIILTPVRVNRSSGFSLTFMTSKLLRNYKPLITLASPQCFQTF